MFFALFSLLVVPSQSFALQAGDMACEMATVQFSSPTNLQTNVPVDVVPIVGMSTTCDASSQYEVTVSLNGEPIASKTSDWTHGVLNLFDVAPTDPLQPNTEYTLTITGVDGWGPETILSFTTGEGQVGDISGRPAATMHDAWIHHYDDEAWGSAGAAYTVEPAEDSHELSVIMVFNDAEPDVLLDALRVGEFNEDHVETYWSIAAPFPEEHCLTLAQRDGRGQISERSEPFCMNAELRKEKTGNGRNCAVVTVGGAAWFMPILALAAIRRRRSGNHVDCR